MFLKKCRAFKLDATAEFFKQAGILYSSTTGEIDELDEGDSVNDKDDDDDNNDDNDENRNHDSDDENAPGYDFF